MLSRTLAALWVTCLPALVAGPAALASSYGVINGPGTPLYDAAAFGLFAADADGNLFVEAYPLSASSGTVYKLMAQSGYHRQLQIFAFGVGKSDPNMPMGGLTLTNRNQLLGTTLAGDQYGLGDIFDLGPAGEASLTSLHAFSGGDGTVHTDGSYSSGLSAGTSNHFYGTTIYGGIGSSKGYEYTGSGTLYQVIADKTDPKYRILHKFGGAGDGINPTAGRLAIDAQGRLYGTTTLGGASGVGTVFVAQEVDGAWQEQPIYSFAIKGDFQQPRGNVVFDAHGNLYGCAQGGAHQRGGIFSLSPPVQQGGSWTETILYTFGDNGNKDPIAANIYRGFTTITAAQGCAITLDQSINLIVGTSVGGGDMGFGTIFVLTPPASGETAWTETVGHSFGHKETVGFHPLTQPLKVGNVYYGSASRVFYAFSP